MNNRFELRGPIVSYGSSKGQDWIDISTDDGSITCFLADNNLGELERSYNLTESYAIVKGYLKSDKYSDQVFVVATDVEVV